MPDLTGVLPDKLKNQLNIISQALSHFWEQWPHQHFTNHDLAHSESVQQKLTQLAQELPQVLTDDEILLSLLQFGYMKSACKAPSLRGQL